MRLGRSRSLYTLGKVKWVTFTRTSSESFGAAGRVEVQVGMRRSQFENPVATLTFHIPGP